MPPPVKLDSAVAVRVFTVDGRTITYPGANYYAVDGDTLTIEMQSNNDPQRPWVRRVVVTYRWSAVVAVALVPPPNPPVA